MLRQVQCEVIFFFFYLLCLLLIRRITHAVILFLLFKTNMHTSKGKKNDRYYAVVRAFFTPVKC